MLLGCLKELLSVREGAHLVQAVHLRPTEQLLKPLPAFDQW